MKKTFGLIMIFVFFLSVSNLSAEEIDGAFSLIISPSVPRPEQSIEVYIDAPGIDLNNSNIKWVVNGTLIKSGKGEKTLSTSARRLGQQTTVSAEIESPIGIFTRSVTINPSEIDVFWQGKTYTPPFFKGLPLWARQSDITIFAIPHVITSGNLERPPSSLTYKWTKNGEVLGNVSGLGKNTLTFTDSVLSKPQVIKVEILVDKNTIVASRTFEISSIVPEILVYENNPLYGVMSHKGIGSNYTIENKEVTFIAFPLFFSVGKILDTSLKHKWLSDRSTENVISVTYRAPENTSGVSQVKIEVSNENKIIQSANKSFLVKFNER